MTDKASDYKKINIVAFCFKEGWKNMRTNNQSKKEVKISVERYTDKHGVPWVRVKYDDEGRTELTLPEVEWAKRCPSWHIGTTHKAA
jgi:hypothetical protein